MFETTVGIRYADLDTYGHVNNAVYATLLEEARIDYLGAVLPDAGPGITGTGDGPGIVLANLEMTFEAPLRSDAVTVGIEVPDLGESSIRFVYEVRADGATVATAETTVVVIDRETGRSQPIPQEWRERITDFES